MNFVARWAGAMALASFTFVVGAAQAEEVATGAAEIQLKNGDTMRGTIVQVEPGQRVIVIVAGEQSVIPWGDIAQIVGGPREPAAPAAPAPTPATTAAPAVPTKGMPIVHIESDYPDAELSRIDGRSGTGFRSTFMCSAPCDKPIDGRDGHRFYIEADGMLSSPPFRLVNVDGPVTARVTGLSFTRHAVAQSLVAMGSVLTFGGIMFTAVSFFMSETPTEEHPDPQAEIRTARTGGIVLMSVAVPALVTGAILLATQGPTRVELIKPRGHHTGVILENGILRF